MITIKRIEIEGFFGYGNFVWDLDPMVNILGGKNGSGKSTIFKLCYTLLSKGNVDSIDEIKQYSYLLKGVKIIFSNEWILMWKTAEENEMFDRLLPMAFKYDIQVYDSDSEKRTFSELSSQLNVHLINSFEQHVAKAIQYDKQPKSQSLYDPTMLDLMIKEEIAIRNQQAIEVLMDSTEDDDLKRVESKKSFNKMYGALAHFLKVYDTPFKSTFEFSKNNHSFGYEHLSMGEKQILLLLLMVSNTNQEPCIFFMDEPDLSMHIDWKEILIKELHDLNPNMQIILSTHAPSVITGWHDKVKEVSQLIK